MYEFAAFIMGARWRAVVLASLFALTGVYFVPMVILSAAVIALVTLRNGWLEGIVIFIAAAVVTLGIFMALPPRPGFPFPLAIVLWPPVMVAAEVLRRTYSQGFALLAVAAFMLAYVAVVHSLTGDVVAFWEQWLQQAVANVKGATVEGFKHDGTLRLFNGLVAMLYTASVVSALLLARWWQAILYNPGGFQKEFCQLRLPRSMLLGAVLLIWLAGTVNKILMVDLLMVAMMIYLFQGLAVLHGMLVKQGLTGFLMVPVYGLLLFMPQYGVMGLALLGAIDTFIDFRRRIEADKPS
ncbi:MAG: hypothetical protein AXA67_06395 [Methylothermaceae bacteria B42]|nr:MAG: hypothetical protein AXA67_06395 [Methylothermaceae bacteria B42]